MNIHEFQGKKILKQFGVAIPAGAVAYTPEEALEAAKRITAETGTETWAVKAQIHAGGRGKGGGVKIARSLDEVKSFTRAILGMNLVTHQTGPEGKIVHKVLIEQGIFYQGESEPQEFYMSVLLNRESGKNIIMYSTEGGMDIETVAEKTPHLIFREEIDPAAGILPYQSRRIAFNLGLSGKAFKEMVKFTSALYTAYENSDSSLFEINPVFKTSDSLIMAADAKVNIDDNALYRHADYAAMRDLNEEDPTEVEAGKFNLNFIKLDGNVGCMVNGAGLAMATMDLIKLCGSEPANFLDVGGSASAQGVENAFRILMSDKDVKCVLINIFGGIVRCDRVANGVVEAIRNIGKVDVPIVVRLEGTNASEGLEILNTSGLDFHTAKGFHEAAQKAAELAEGGA